MDTKEEIRLAWAARDYLYLAHNLLVLCVERFSLRTIMAFSAFAMKLGVTWLFLILLDAIGIHGAGRAALTGITIDGNQLVGLVGICLLVGWLLGWRGRRPTGEH